MSNEQRHTYQVQLTPNEVEYIRETLSLDLHEISDPYIVGAIQNAIDAFGGPPVDETKSEARSTSSFEPSVWIQPDHNAFQNNTEWSIYVDIGDVDPLRIAFESGGTTEAGDTARKIHQFLIGGKIRALSDIIANIDRLECCCPMPNDRVHRIDVISELVDTYRKVHAKN